MPGVLTISPSGDPLAFESAIRRAESGSLIVLQRGIHHTRGYYAGLGWQLPFNGTLRGSGMGNTVLQLTECPPDNWNCAIFSGWGPTGGQQSVSDLTVDLNGQSMPGTTLNAVHLFGDTVSIERVRVINGRGERNLVGANPEAHLLACGPVKDGIRCIATISQCVAEQFIVGPAESLAPEVRAIAWKAQLRLTARFRKLAARMKPHQVVVTAIARELVGFVWAIARTQTLAR